MTRLLHSEARCNESYAMTDISMFPRDQQDLRRNNYTQEECPGQQLDKRRGTSPPAGGPLMLPQSWSLPSTGGPKRIPCSTHAEDMCVGGTWLDWGRKERVGGEGDRTHLFVYKTF